MRLAGDAKTRVCIALMLAALVAGFVGDVSGQAPTQKRFLTGPLTIEDQGSFFIGGVPKVTEHAVRPASGPGSAAAVKEYVDSTVRHRALLAKLGVEGIISNHTDYDSTIAKIQALGARKPGERHPFLTGAESVRRYLTVAEEVGRATLVVASGK